MITALTPTDRHGRDGKLAHILAASEADALLRDQVVRDGMVPRVTAPWGSEQQSSAAATREVAKVGASR